jgi:hypothetical protein
VTLTTFDPCPPTSWERRLFALAHTDVDQDPPCTEVETDAETLQQAYAACDALTEEHSKTFHIASALMPPEKRRGVRALYAFCRISDDLVDHADRSASKPGAGARSWSSRSLTTCRSWPGPTRWPAIASRSAMPTN